MTLLTTLTLNLQAALVEGAVAAQAGVAITAIIAITGGSSQGCAPAVIRLAESLGGLFGDGVRIVQVQGVLIPPKLNQTIATQEEDPDTESVYYLLHRACTAFDPSIVSSIIEPIRIKVVQTQDLSLLTDDERTTVRTLNRLYNTDFDSIISVATHFPQSGLIT